MRTLSLAIATAAAIALAPISEADASILYANQFAGPTPLFIVDQTDGSLTQVSADIGVDDIGDLTSDTRLGSPRLWGISIPGNLLVEINPVTGLASSTVALDSPDNMVSLAFDAVSGVLYGNTSVGFGAPFDALYSIDPATGDTTFIGRIGFDNVFALAFDQSGTLFGVADATDELISIDTNNGNGALIAGLAVGFSFDIASRPEDDAMFLADSGTRSLYTLDTTNGDLTLVGSYAPESINIVGLAFLPVSEPVTLSLLAVGLVGLGAARRAKKA
jgi:hypothetical protein